MSYYKLNVSGKEMYFRSLPLSRMLKAWKQSFIIFSQQNLVAKRLTINSHHKSSASHDAGKEFESVHTFKHRILDFFQKSEKYKVLYGAPSNEKFHLPAGLQATEENKKLYVAKLSTKDLSVLEHSSKIFTKLPPDDKLNYWKSQEKNLHQCSGFEALALAHTQYRIVGDSFKRRSFYWQLLSKAKDWIEKCSTPQELVMWSFLVSLEKSQHSNPCLRCIYERFKTDPALFQCLNSFETSILCNAWFSNNVIVSSKPMLRVIDLLLQTEIESRPGHVTQEALCMLKVFRKAGFGSTNLFESLIASLSSPPARNLNLAQATHALALLADNRCLINEKLIENITHLIEVNAKKPIETPQRFIHPSEGTRVKDLTRFLWTASCLIPTDVISRDRIVAEMIDQVNTGWTSGSFQLDKDWHLLADFFLSLACWKVYPVSLIERVVDRNFIDIVISQKKTIRQSRLALFMEAARIEVPHLSVIDKFLPEISLNLPAYRAEKELIKRPRLASLANVIDRSREELGWENIRCCTTVPHLNYAGLTFNYKREKVAVELLDSYVCMRHSNQPERLMALKIRLSRQLGYRVIQLDVQQTNRKQQETEAKQEDSYTDQQVTMIRKCLENNIYNPR